jgi:hypothetical protein
MKQGSVDRREFMKLEDSRDIGPAAKRFQRGDAASSADRPQRLPYGIG